jgi:hypothetical protein
MKIIVFIFIIFLITGCSHTLHERDRDESNPLDQGSKTELQLRGPKAAIKHSF